jgi:hypothetical protein
VTPVTSRALRKAEEDFIDRGKMRALGTSANVIAVISRRRRVPRASATAVFLRIDGRVD